MADGRWTRHHDGDVVVVSARVAHSNLLVRVNLQEQKSTSAVNSFVESVTFVFRGQTISSSTLKTTLIASNLPLLSVAHEFTTVKVTVEILWFMIWTGIDEYMKGPPSDAEVPSK